MRKSRTFPGLMWLSGVTAVAACGLDDVGFLGTDSPLTAEGGLGGAAALAAGAGGGGAGGCICADAGSVCNADGECVPSCALDGSCEGGASDVELVSDAFGCPGQPASEDDIDADWFDDGISLENEVPMENQHLLIERSTAMSDQWNDGTRWSSVFSALLSLPDPQPNTTRTLRFFPARGNWEVACEEENYIDPVAVYDSGGFDSASLLALGSSLDPSGYNSLVRAIAGTLEGIAEQRIARSTVQDRLVIVVGTYPNLCVEDPEFKAVAELVAAAREFDPPIRTSVIAVGNDINVDPVAIAADSAPYRIPAGDDGASLVRALRSGQSCDGADALGSTSISTPESPERVDVLLESPGQGDTVERVPEVANAEACSESTYGGWYFVDSDERKEIMLCKCSSLRAACATTYVLRGSDTGD